MDEFDRKEMDEFDRNEPEFVDVIVRKSKRNGKWIIRIEGVTSGFIVHTSEDNSSIEFGFDAERFEPFAIIK